MILEKIQSPFRHSKLSLTEGICETIFTSPSYFLVSRPIERWRMLFENPGTKNILVCIPILFTLAAGLTLSLIFWIWNPEVPMFPLEPIEPLEPRQRGLRRTRFQEFLQEIENDPALN